MRRRLPVGAEPVSTGTHFRVWAPDHEHVEVVVLSGAAAGAHDLAHEVDGWFSGSVAEVGAGALYRIRPGDGDALPDPASRFQPDGPHGPSAVIDPGAFQWSDDDWRGPDGGRQVVYEMHVGTFTPAGTWTAATERLPHLADLGISIIEVMPVMEFPGRFNWGYDVASPFAPAHVYGTPDDMRSFVNRAHELRLAVILDVVYNHTGPDGCYLARFASAFYSATHTTDWGPALNFDGAHSAHVRDYFLANVEYWISEFHLDGLRFDATQNIYDTGPRHILADMTTRARAAAARRRLWIVGENEPQDTRLLRDPATGGFGMDAVWNDDFHHSAMAALMGIREAYYEDYAGTPQELISCAQRGFLYQGQYYRWQSKRRGTSTRDVPLRCFVNFIQNHDQIANSDSGRRIHQLTGPAELRAMTTLMMLMPGTPMLFQGQEIASSTRFLFFADHHTELAEKVSEGRRSFLAQFRATALPEVQERIPEPSASATVETCRIVDENGELTQATYRLHRDLIRMARTDAVLSNPDTSPDGAVLGQHALALRYPGEQADDRLLIINLGADLEVNPASEPLLAPPAHRGWKLRFSSEHPDYGGRGGWLPEIASGWLVQARSAALLVAEPIAARNS